MSKFIVKKLSQSIPSSLISTVVYKLNKLNFSNTEIKISDSGNKVLIYGDSEEVLNEVLIELEKIINNLDSLNNIEKQILFTLPKIREKYYGINHFLKTKEISINSNGIILTGKIINLLNQIDEIILEFANQENAVLLYSEPIWSTNNVQNYGYQTEDDAFHKITKDGIISHEQSIFQIAVCNNIWQYLANSYVNEGQTYTIKGICSRNEKQYNFLERMKFFTMREIVFIGSRESSLSFQERALKFLIDMSSKLYLSGYIENANDPFFIRGETKYTYDLPSVIKQELRLYTTANHTIAASSVNLHGNFFAKNLDIKLSNSQNDAWTCCCAFGLERWLWAILAQYGDDYNEICTR